MSCSDCPLRRRIAHQRARRLAWPSSSDRTAVATMRRSRTSLQPPASPDAAAALDIASWLAAASRRRPPQSPGRRLSARPGLPASRAGRSLGLLSRPNVSGRSLVTLRPCVSTPLDCPPRCISAAVACALAHPPRHPAISHPLPPSPSSPSSPAGCATPTISTPLHSTPPQAPHRNSQPAHPMAAA